MGRLLILEWLKIKGNRSFIVIILLYMLALPAFFATLLSFDFPKELTRDSIYGFPHVWSNLGYIGNWITFFCFGFLAILLITNEYANKTLRQNIMTGMSRNEFLGGKLLMMGAISLFATTYYSIIALGFGYAFTDTILPGRVMEKSYYFFTFGIQCFGVMSFALMLGVLIKRTGLSIIIYLFYGLFFEFIIRNLIHARLFSLGSARFYPLNAIEDLVPFPNDGSMMNMIENMAEQEGVSIYLNLAQALSASTIYITIFIGISFLIINKRDL